MSAEPRTGKKTVKFSLVESDMAFLFRTHIQKEGMKSTSLHIDANHIFSVYANYASHSAGLNIAENQ